MNCVTFLWVMSTKCKCRRKGTCRRLATHRLFSMLRWCEPLRDSSVERGNYFLVFHKLVRIRTSAQIISERSPHPGALFQFLW